MTSTQEVTKQRGRGRGRPEDGNRLHAVPQVDIFEDATASAVLDMPGVTKDRLKIEAEREALVVEGEAAINVPNGIEPLRRVRSTLPPQLHADQRVTTRIASRRA